MPKASLWENLKFDSCAKGIPSGEFEIWYLKFKKRGVAQPGSALDWGSRGREFKSPHSDFDYQMVIQFVLCSHFLFAYDLHFIGLENLISFDFQLFREL